MDLWWLHFLPPTVVHGGIGHRSWVVATSGTPEPHGGLRRADGLRPLRPHLARLATRPPRLPSYNRCNVSASPFKVVGLSAPKPHDPSAGAPGAALKPDGVECR